VNRTIAALIIAATLAVPAAAGAVTPRASLTDIEKDVMCVVCKEPLAVSQSPQADSERTFISGLIANGETKAQIEKALVVQFGPAVLGLPPAHGFNLTLYVLPPAVLLSGAILLVIALPRWKRRTRANAQAAPAAAAVAGPEDAARLEEELARFGR
jgi:cytochrome c-type biogenesis protein CcmH